MDRQTDYFGDANHDSVTTEMDLLSIDVENTGNNMNQLENVTDEDKIREDSASASNVSQSHDINSESETESINAKITSIGDHMLNHMTWPPYVVVGPPGTGKTESLVYSCMSLMQGWGKRKPARVLLATHNDRGADSILHQLRRRAFDSCELPITVRRVHKPATLASQIRNDVIEHCYISGDVTTLPDVATLSDVGIVVTTFDIISYIYQTNSQEKAKYTHILLDDVHRYPFDKLCSFLGAIPDKTSVAMTLSTLLDDTTRQAASSTDLQPSTTRDPSKRIFLSNLQNLLTNPKNMEPFVFENFQRFTTTYRYSKNMLDFMNTCVLDEQDVMQPNRHVEDSDFITQPVQINATVSFESIEQFADRIVNFRHRWPDQELAAVLLNQKQLDEVHRVLCQLSTDCSTVSLFTVDSISGHHFDTVYMFIGSQTEVPLCLMDAVAIQTLLTCAFTQLILFVDEETVKHLCDTSPLWKKVMDRVIVTESEHGSNIHVPLVCQSNIDHTHNLVAEDDENEPNSTDTEYPLKNLDKFTPAEQFMDADENDIHAFIEEPKAIVHVESPEPCNEYAPSNISQDSEIDPYSKWRSAANSECNLSLDDERLAEEPNMLMSDVDINEVKTNLQCHYRKKEDALSEEVAIVSNFGSVKEKQEEDDIPIERTWTAMEECDALYPESYQISFPPERKDYRSFFTITIGQGEDRAVAFSAGREASGDIWLLIHVTDVTHFVGQDSEMDRAAANKGYSLYIPGKEVVYMLPKRLSTDLCSFLPGEDRLAWSVVICMDNNFNVCKDVEIKQTTIQVDKAFTHDDIDNFFNNTVERTIDIVEMLEILEKFSKVARGNRLGNASPAFTNIETTSSSLMMITEITTFTNVFVSQHLLNVYDDKTPLLNHHKTYLPSSEWRMRYADIARFSLGLSYLYLPDFSICKCKDKCTCLQSYQENRTGHVMHFCEISKSRWSKVESMYKNKELADLKILLSDVLNFPETTFALQEITELMKRDVYSTASDPNRGHHVLNQCTYTTFTQPLQRFIDIVVQRMLKCSLSYTELQYTSDDLDDICFNTTEKINAGKNNEYREFLHLVTEATKKRPLSVEMIVSKVSLAEIKLANPLALLSPSTVDDSRDVKYKPSQFLDRTFDLKLNNLMLNEKPVYVGEDLRLEWQELIYSTQSTDIASHITDEVYQIDSDYLTKRVPVEDCERLAVALRSGDRANIIKATKRMIDYTKIENNAILNDFSSEILRTKSDQPGMCNVFALYKVGTAMKVQLTSGIDRVMDVPKIQLFSLTPTVDICVEHNQNKALCFEPVPEKPVDDDVYEDMEDYKDRWVTLIRYEAAESAIVSNDGSVIHGMHIIWTMEPDGELLGAYSYSFPEESEDEERKVAWNGYACVRYKSITDHNGTINKSVRELYKGQDTFTWVGHGRLTLTELGVRVIKLHDSCVEFPDILLTEEGQQMSCSVQMIQMPQPHIFKLRAVHDVGLRIKDKLKNEMRDQIFMGTIKRTAVPVQSELDQEKLPSIGKVNNEQEEAIQQAMSSNFSLIHGPPGTGKTATASRLVYMFVKRNELNGYRYKCQNWQVLYCAPSNKAADVILGYFRKMRSLQPIVIRSYASRIECHDFGTPEQMRSKEKSTFTMDPLYKRFALHFVIREPGHPFATRIIAMDRLFHDHPEMITSKLKEKFRELTLKACKFELARAEVIVTTCTGCCSTRFDPVMLRQVVVDETAMSCQPETLVPLAYHTPQQVTLIGDHKQLQPVLLTDPAKELGMLRSMFERYVDVPGMAVMLTTQYRMHESIVAVPSKCFYDDKLRCGNPSQKSPSTLKFWPGGCHVPIALCHVIGSEALTTVATRESSDKSKSNEDEALIANKIVRLLITRHGIKQEQIAILTQYRAQHSLIEKLVEEELPNVTVNTVTSSQGDEWDYVILSTVRTVNPENIPKNPAPTWIQASLGFITDEHQVDVALTRAKYGLIIVGNYLLLQCHPVWKELVSFYKANDAIINANDFLRRLCSHTP